MARPAIFTEKEIAFLHELVRCRVEFMIVGLAAAALQGAPAVTQDIDLWFECLEDPNIRTALKKVGGAYVASTGATPAMFVGKNVALFDVVMAMHGLKSFSDEIRSSIKIRIGRMNVPVLPLQRIIASKKAANREKDKLILPVLEDTLAVLEERESSRTRGKS